MVEPERRDNVAAAWQNSLLRLQNANLVPC
jgi:hypothetical protein